MPYRILNSIGSGNSLLPDSIKPLPEPSAILDDVC